MKSKKQCPGAAATERERKAEAKRIYFDDLKKQQIQKVSMKLSSQGEFHAH
ncbi:hypothetical protein [Hahella ganghwensis]|uniref:hypothetical protein n=1 Tax=Hahella ganghwensis TaxID=286420 RepID=UPI00035F3371|nr:hypothetical protein [Hahella ganghwensis]